MRTRPALLVLPLLLGLAACGGSDAADNSSAEVTREAYLEETDALCRETKSRIDALEAELDLGDPASFTTYIESTVEEAATFTEAVADITRPDADSERIRTIFLEPLQAQVATLQAQLPQIRDAIDDGGIEGLQTLDLEEPPQADTVEMRAYGFSAACLGVAANE